MNKRFVALLVLIIGTALLPVVQGIFTNILDASKFNIYYLLIIVTLSVLLLYFMNDSLEKDKIIKEIAPPKFDVIKSDLSKKSEIEIIPNSAGLYEYQLNSFLEFNVSTYSKRRSSFTDATIESIKNPIYDQRDTAIIIMGESGLGKTTFAKWLTTEIAKTSLTGQKNFIPHLLFLSEFNNHIDKNGELLLEYTVLCENLDPNSYKLIFILDGLNEIKKERFRDLLSQIRKFCNNKGFKYSLVITSRPLDIDNDIFELLPQELNTFFFKIANWSNDQVAKYLNFAGIPLKDIHSYSEDLINLLKIPFFAFLFASQKRILNNENISSLKELVESFLEIWLNPQKYHSEYHQIKTRNKGNPLVKFEKEKKRDFIEDLAYNLNKNEELNFDSEKFETLLALYHLQPLQMTALLKELINYGIITETNSEVNQRFKFRHQIFQEYLTASYYLKNNIAWFKNPSSNKFWKDVPLYQYLQLKNEIDRSNFINAFKAQGDLLTYARLAALNVDGHRLDILSDAVDQVILSFLDFDSYPYSSEVIAEAGPIGETKLLTIINSVDENVIAREELNYLHQLSEEEIESRELRWREIGRSIQMLSVIKSPNLIGVLSSKILRIKSDHLVYHILEYTINTGIKGGILSRLASLNMHLKLRKNTNPIIRAYNKILLISALRLSIKSVYPFENEWRNTLSFVKDNLYLENEAFIKSFWKRNHGIECLSSILRSSHVDDFTQLLIEVLQKEESFQYSVHRPYYFAVHTSILKSLSILSRRGIVIDNPQLLKKIINSRRIAENPWALKHLGDYLLTVFKKDRLDLLKSLVEENISATVHQLIKSHISALNK